MMAGITAACRRRKIGVVLAVFAGQSNMRGYSTTGSDVPIDLQGTDSGARIWSGTSGTIELYEAGVNSDAWTSGTSTPQKWGPEAAFLKAFRAANPSTEIIAVKLAVDASYLGAVSGSDWNVASSGELLDALKTEVAAAKSAVAGEGKTIAETVFLWMQGEADADDGVHSTNYGLNCADLITFVHTNIGDSATKFILGRISPLLAKTASYAVRAFQTRFADDTNGVWAIDADGYPVSADNINLNPTGLQKLGEDMFAAFNGTYQDSIPAKFITHPAYKHASITLTNSNLTAEGGGATASAYQLVASDKFFGGGKRYIEYHIDAQVANLNVGLGYMLGNNNYLGNQAQGVGYFCDGNVWQNAANIRSYASYRAGDTIMVAFDSATGKIWFGKNGIWNGDPAAGTGNATIIATPTATSYPRTGATLRRAGDKVTVKCNASDWIYVPPSGFGPI